MSVVEIFAWGMQHKAEILTGLSGVVLAASLLVKSLAMLASAVGGLLDLVTTIFPKLKAADGAVHGSVAWLGKVSDWLDGLSKSPWLNAMAINHKAVVLAALCVGLLGPGRAVAAPKEVPEGVQAPASTRTLLKAAKPSRGSVQDIKDAQASYAQGFDWSIGPTVPFLEYDPGAVHPLSIAPGAGLQLSVTHDALKRAFFGKAWDLLSLDLMAFGSVVSGNSGNQFGALSAAAALCTMSSLVCLGGGKHLLSSDQGVTKGGYFMVLALSVNFATSPVSPPAGMVDGPVGLPRGNTLYFGGL